jgi:hypothetical protein
MKKMSMKFMGKKGEFVINHLWFFFTFKFRVRINFSLKNFNFKLKIVQMEILLLQKGKVEST